MELEAALRYAELTLATSEVLRGWIAWTKMVDGNERDETLVHIRNMSRDYHALTTAISDYNGVAPGMS